MLRAYLRSLIYVAVFTTLALMLTPRGRMKNVVRFVCAAAMLTAMLLPVGKIDFGSYSELLAGYRADAEKYSDAGKENSENLHRLYIQEKCEAYILDKAAALGAELRSVKVLAEWSEKGYFYPASVEIEADCDGAVKKRIAAYIEAELGIEKTAQSWRAKDEAQKP